MIYQSKSSKTHLLKLIVSIQIIFGILLCGIGCDEKQSPTITHSFSGIIVFDNQGFPMATWGHDDGDWEEDENWTEEEYALLDFMDTVSISGTFLKDTSEWNGTGIGEIYRNEVIAFPNPAINNLNMIARGLGLVKFKANIVDKYHNSLFTYACKDSTRIISLDVTDSSIFEDGEIYRLYYSLSVEDNLNFYKGHGDILICREDLPQECEKYVP